MISKIALAAGMLALAEIGDQVLGCDDRLFLVDQGGGHDAAGGAQRLQQLMHLGLVLAAGPQAFPHEGHGIEPHHIHALVGKEEHDLDDLEKHLRV